MVTKLAQMYPVGKDICVITDSSVGPLKSHTVTIYVPLFPNWKIRIAYVNSI
jgi:hypothetical protein